MRAGGHVGGRANRQAGRQKGKQEARRQVDPPLRAQGTWPKHVTYVHCRESWSKIHRSFSSASSADIPPKQKIFSRILVEAWPLRGGGCSVPLTCSRVGVGPLSSLFAAAARGAHKTTNHKKKQHGFENSPTKNTTRSTLMPKNPS